MNVTGMSQVVGFERIQAVEKKVAFKGLKDEFYLVEYFDSYDRPAQDVLLYVGDGEFYRAWWKEEDEDDADAACDISVAACDAISIWEIKREREK